MTHTVKNREHTVLNWRDSPLMHYTPEQWVACANQRINQALTIRRASAASTRTQDEIVRAWSHVRAIQERRLQEAA